MYSLGEVPYDWLSNKEVSEQIATGLRLSKPGNCPGNIWKIIEGCWNMEPQARPNFLKLCQDLKNCESEVPKVIEQESNQNRSPEVYYNNV